MFEFIMAGALALNMTLVPVANRRNVLFNQNLDYVQYDCLIGVPYSQRHHFGNEVYFYDGLQSYGPFLVVDVEAGHHKGWMREAGIAADINCRNLVHKKGFLYSQSTSR